MLGRKGFDAVAINTPDSMHREPTITALEAGLDVIPQKLTADKIIDTHAMIRSILFICDRA